MDNKLERLLAHGATMGGVLCAFEKVVVLEDKGRLVWFKFASKFNLLEVRVCKAEVRKDGDLDDIGYNDYDVYARIYLNEEGALDALRALVNKLETIAEEDSTPTSARRLMEDYTLSQITNVLKGVQNGESF